MHDQILRLDGADSTLLLHSRARRQFEIAYWGDRLPQGMDTGPIMALLEQSVPHGVLDQAEPLPLVPEAGAGFVGTPGLELHCDGKDFITCFHLHDLVAGQAEASISYRDELLPVVLEVRLAIDAATDVLTVRTVLRNEGDRVFTVDWLAACALPVPSRCDELLAFHGRWCREFHEARQRLGPGKWCSENRTGRTSHQSFPGLVVGTPGFAAATGEVYGLHLGWSGNHRVLVERLRDGRLQAQLGELALPGEILLHPGTEYSSPVAYAVRSCSGLNGMSRRLHEHVRRRVLPRNVRRQPRPVSFNTWEAVYFAHDQARLERLIEAVAALGVERFVLDDGWFRGRDHDRAGLGDWQPCPRRYPQGLGPIAASVRARGMQFGLWIEPEMVNADSDLYRAHPDWVMGVPGREQPLGRNQYLLDLGRDEVSDHLFHVIDGLVTQLRLDFLKWDMNRDMTHAVDARGRPAAGRHVRAVYALMDRLRAKHPQLEIESCASGGARADYGILGRTERIWTSDNNDPLERQRIQQGFALFFPPEVMGCHVGPQECHATGRRVSMAMRAGTALAGHFGIEFDPLRLDDGEQSELLQWIEVHKQARGWLHDSQTCRLDHPDSSVVAVLRVARDGERALLTVAKLDTSAVASPAIIGLTGLEPDAMYRVRRVEMREATSVGAKRSTAFLDGAALDVPGVALVSAGLALPLLPPGTLCLFWIERLRAGGR